MAPADYSMVTTIPTEQELMVYQTWAKNAYESQMYRNVGKESAIMMIMLAAREYGIGPAQALNGGLHIIEGKVELSARVMSALIRRAKHKLHIIESTNTKCVIKGIRSDTGEEHTASFTIEEAQQAGLVKEKGGWKRTPIDMLYARTISRLARQLFSDVIGIGYIEGEISQPDRSVCVLDDGINNEAMLMERYRQEQDLMCEFITSIVDHFKIQRNNVIKTLLEDEQKTKLNFEVWKQKRINEKVVSIDAVVSDV